jgi:hypothetical protein
MTNPQPSGLSDEEIHDIATEAGFGFFGRWMLYQGARSELIAFARAIERRAPSKAAPAVEEVLQMVRDAIRSAIERLAASPVASPQPEPCPRGRVSQPDKDCTNRHQCWEPCGELGHSAEHCVAASPELSAAIDAPKAGGRDTFRWEDVRDYNPEESAGVKTPDGEQR